MRVNRALGAAAVVLGGLLCFASVAFGCASVTSPYVEAKPGRGEAATVTTVRGGNWLKSTQVDLRLVRGDRWTTESGELMKSVTTDSSGMFSSNVTIPADASAGAYYVVAEGISATDGTTATARATFEVIAPAGSTDPGQSRPAGSTSASVSGGSGSPTPAQTGTVTPAAGAGTGGLPTAGGLPTPGDTPSAVGDQYPAAASPSPATANAPGARSTAGAQSATAPAAAADRRPSAGVSSASAAGVGAPVATKGSDEQATPSPASATGDVWGGFAEGPSRLTPSLADLPSPGSSTSPAVVGGVVAMLALVGLVGGFATAELRRRRVPVSGERRS